MPRSFFLFCLLSLVFLSGCKNSCQSLCADIEDFAKDCGYEFSATDYRECLTSNRWISFADKKECRSASPKLEAEWTCEDISVYFDDETLFTE